MREKGETEGPSTVSRRRMPRAGGGEAWPLREGEGGVLPPSGGGRTVWALTGEGGGGVGPSRGSKEEALAGVGEDAVPSRIRRRLSPSRRVGDVGPDRQRETGERSNIPWLSVI